jgi:serine/threonine-protein kinase
VKKIESCFTAAMGPIGPKIVRKAIAAGMPRSALRTELLEAIPVEKDRATFLRCCGNLLAGGPEVAVRAPTQSRPPKAPAPEPTGAALLDPAGITELKTTLATFLGPLARVMVDRALPKAESVNDLIRQLAGDLDTVEDRERFTRAATQNLQKHFRLK